jgi:hypothetical protein
MRDRYVRMRQTASVMEERFDRVKHTQHCRKLALKKGADPDLLIEVEVSDPISSASRMC